ncbi:MAG: hypothetical protein SPD11_10045 [Sphaerochaetaceae bacterium]|nr:hypothetical protein [Sphaerochaetaceae bacterium]
MKYITIIARNYDEAVRKGRAQYGEALRIHSRRDIPVRGGFLWLGKRTRTEITCYLSESGNRGGEDREALLKEFELEARTPAPGTANATGGYSSRSEPPQAMTDPVPSESGDASADGASKALTTSGPGPAVGAASASGDVPESSKGFSDGTSSSVHGRFEDLLEHGRELLLKNDFSRGYIDSTLEVLRAEQNSLQIVPSPEEFELRLVDHILASVEIDHASQLHPPKVFILLGPTGIGKTTTIAKIAALYGTLPPEEFRRKVAIITLDTFRIGAYEQIASFGEALSIPVFSAEGEDEFYRLLDELSGYDLILVDTIGKSPRDKELAVKLKTLLSVPSKEGTKCYLAVSASMKEADICKALEQFSPFGIESLVVTKTDETQTIGNIVSIGQERKLPLLFITDGQKVPKDIHKASSAYVLNLLQGFSMDFGALWENQISQ